MLTKSNLSNDRYFNRETLRNCPYCSSPSTEARIPRYCLSSLDIDKPYIDIMFACKSEYFYYEIEKDSFLLLTKENENKYINRPHRVMPSAPECTRRQYERKLRDSA